MSRGLRFSPERRPPPPRLGAILASDYPAVLCLIGPVVAGAIAALGALGGDAEKVTFFGPLAGLVTLICIPLFVVRIRAYQRIFRRGIEVPGEVIDVGFHKDRGTVAFSYTHEGRSRETSRALHKSKKAVALRPGQEVVVVVDAQDPKQALIRDLFV